MNSQKQSDPRERILEAADRLFYTEGVRATGTEKIMSVSEVAKATFYRHFPSKDDLVIAYLEYRDRSFFEYLDSPAPPEDIHEALARIERVVNRADIIGCPFLRIASEYPDFDHPFHRVAVEHENKFLAYLINLLKPFAIDKKRRLRRYLASSMVASPRECSMGHRKRFRFSRPPRQYSRAFRARELSAANDGCHYGAKPNSLPATSALSIPTSVQ
jgi:AcrR family transcriptional regulator